MKGRGAGSLDIPVWLLGLVTISGTLGMHIFVPALPSAAADLGTSPAVIQYTITVYIIGMALGQLFYGPLSDRFGRRPTLIAGLSIYCLGSFLAVFAPGEQSLIACRLLQAVGSCSALVIGRAVVRDIAVGDDAVRKMSLVNMITVIAPGIAPIMGSFMVLLSGWRSIFWLMTALSVGAILLVWSRLPETLARNSTPSVLGRNFKGLVTSRSFLALAVGGGCATTSMYAFIAAAPFIFVDILHRPIHEIGFYLALIIVGVWLGNASVPALVRRFTLPNILKGANLISLAAALIFLIGVLSDHLSTAFVVGIIAMLSFGVGIASPAASTEAVSLNPLIIGSASGLFGFTQMVVGAICTALVGFGRDPALAAALVLSGAGFVAQFSFWVALRRG